MEKWARRQDKIKMSFKQPQIPVSTVEKSSVSNVMSKPINKNVVESQLEPIKVGINWIRYVLFLDIF